MSPNNLFDLTHELIEQAESNPQLFATKTVDQIVNICDNGKLLDNSKCSILFRKFLTHQNSFKLSEYAIFCLENRFDKSGIILQDVVTE
jgi:hypothetical protein